MMQEVLKFFKDLLRHLLVLVCILLGILVVAASPVFLQYSTGLPAAILRPMFIGIISSKTLCSMWPWCNEAGDKIPIFSPNGKMFVTTSSRCCKQDCSDTVELAATATPSTQNTALKFLVRFDCPHKFISTNISWMSDNELKVKADFVGAIQIQEFEVEGVKITYNINASKSNPPESLAMLGIVSYPDTFTDIDVEKAEQQIRELEASGQISMDQLRRMFWELDVFKYDVCQRAWAIMGPKKVGK